MTLVGDAEHTQDWNQEEWIDVLSRSTDKPRVEYCEDQKGTIMHTRSLQGHTVELEGTHIPHGQLFHQQINPRKWSFRRFESKKQKEDKLVFSQR